MEWISFVLFFLAGLVHVGFFIFESFLLQRTNGAKLLKISAEAHSNMKVWALNQGFYNLFLAIGIFVGLSFVIQKKVMLAGVLVGFSGLSMLSAGVVLWFSAPKLRKFAWLQLSPPLLGFIFLFFHIRNYLSS